VAPWLVRNVLTFGSLFPGQAIENALLTRNEDIFAFADRPAAGTFLGQGAPTLVANVVDALSRNLVDVLLISAAPVGLIGLIGLVAFRDRRLRSSALAALVVTAALTYLVTSVAFPVASRWGTFLHAAGPALVALVVLAALVLDAGIARIRRLRRWSRPNAWLAPAATLALAVPFAVLQVGLVARQAHGEQTRFAGARVGLERALQEAALPGGGGATASPIVTDHPIWLAETLRRPALALPHEPPTSVLAIAAQFDARLVVLVDGRREQAAALAAMPECFSPLPLTGTSAVAFRIADACRR
jgi:hypothetical protein